MGGLAPKAKIILVKLGLLEKHQHLLSLFFQESF